MQTIDNTWIPLADGTHLAARIWLPDTAPLDPVPAILEYLPYRKSDGTAIQDLTRHPYFAQHGFAGVRVDIRGSGDSDGIIPDEYSRQEHDDALEVIAWIAEQPWCSGSVGMIGYSWGGFNGLQIAARRPPALKAVVTMYSTDDRYRDDCHYMGGCLLASDMLKWATAMRGYNALPPDPTLRDDWREVWLDRMDRTPAFIEPWLTHQKRDAYWMHGSVAGDYGAIEAATLIVGGWADAYTNAVPRLLANLTCPRKAIIGPWSHVVPYAGVPGPAIDFLSECIRWFSRWLADKPTGVERDPDLRVWIADTPAADAGYEDREGRWMTVSNAALAAAENLEFAPGPDGSLSPAGPVAGSVTLHTPQHLGASAGVWCANGMPDELPVDQRPDDELSACFDTAPFDAPVDLLGKPIVRLRLAADAPTGSVVARLCVLAPDGSSALLAWGQLNLPRHASDAEPRPLTPGEYVDVEVGLNDVGVTVSAGHRLRLALSSTYWPHVWPTADDATLVVDLSASSLVLPLLPESAAVMDPPFAPSPTASRGFHPGGRVRTRGVAKDSRQLIVDIESGGKEVPGGAVYSAALDDRYLIAADDPLTAECRSSRIESLARGEWRVSIEATATMRCDRDEFVVEDRLQAWEADKPVYDRTQTYRIPRDLL